MSHSWVIYEPLTYLLTLLTGRTVTIILSYSEVGGSLLTRELDGVDIVSYEGVQTLDIESQFVLSSRVDKVISTTQPKDET